ncbi:MAG: hypothetical protein Unbinned5081contig1002_3 [Prokaryotic dsDNA virus sp.]|nr:MAG: hypothetical protein Unbinned5081contig1002_3 [Prokaryotic dsDNA virus sp.]|tara:strand:+ start:6553 stop:6744 length:192 start_codon:yes stop_codon:yes gene_type:complete
MFWKKSKVKLEQELVGKKARLDCIKRMVEPRESIYSHEQDQILDLVEEIAVLEYKLKGGKDGF